MSPEELTILRLPSGKKLKSKSKVRSFNIRSPLSYLSGRIKYFRRNRRRTIRFGLIAGNLAIIAITGLIITKYSGSNVARYNVLKPLEEAQISNPLDTVTAAEIAANVALMTRIPETDAVLSYSNLVWAELSEVSASEQKGTISIPQVLSGDIKTKDDIITYIVQEGDTLESLANKFGVTSNSIRWSNDISGNRLTVGAQLLIPPVNGIAYKVKAGDTAAALATKYNVSAEAIIRFNDAEIAGLQVDELIVIPGGEVRVAAAPRAAYSLSYRATFSRNITFITRYTSYPGIPWYDRGWCTDWASYRAAQLGNPVGNWGNANRWDDRARAEGYYVGPVPRVGAVLQTDRGYAGHVGVVEEVSPDGTMIKFSDMNGLAGWGNAARTNDWVPAAGYRYIYR